jgi:hypothetical protein
MVRKIRAVGLVIESTYNGVRVIWNTSFTFLALYVWAKFNENCIVAINSQILKLR